MKLKEIYDFLDSIAPFKTQCDFDNAGFLVGDINEEFKGAVVALDVTEGAIKYAESIGANLIISHHPVIFEPLKSVTCESLVYRLIKSGINVISAHTNLDMAEGGINDKLAELIGLENVGKIVPEGEVFAARMGEIPEEMSADEFGLYLKGIFSGAIKYCDPEKPIKRIAICSGSGGSLLEEIAKEGADAFVTADVKHNVFLDAAHLGISIYDCGHFDTEDIIVKPLCNTLNERFGEGFFEYHSELIKTAEIL